LTAISSASIIKLNRSSLDKTKPSVRRGRKAAGLRYISGRVTLSGDGRAAEGKPSGNSVFKFNGAGEGTWMTKGAAIYGNTFVSPQLGKKRNLDRI
jgi:hypothetical protein